MQALDDLLAQSDTLRAGILLDPQGNILDVSGSESVEADTVAAVVTMARPQLAAALEHVGMGKVEGLALGTPSSSLHARFGGSASVVLVGHSSKSVEVLQKKLEQAMDAVASSLSEGKR